MTYKIKENAKNVWIRNNENTQDLSPLTDANSVYFNNGRTLEQELGKGAMESNVVTIDSAMSKVIDEAYDGVYESCVFKGRSLVNLVEKPTSANVGSGKKWNGYGGGNPSKTFIENGIRLANTRQGSIVLDYFDLSLFKPNTKYTLFIDVYHNGEGAPPVLDKIAGTGQYAIPLKNGHNCIVFTTISDLTSANMGIRFGYAGSTSESCVYEFSNIIIIEGDHSSIDPDYFEGLCDSKMPILRNVGKNLLDPQTFIPFDRGVEYVRYEDGYVLANFTNANTHFFYKVDLTRFPKGTYTVIAKHEGERSYLGIQHTFKDGTKTWGKTQFNNDGSYAELGLYMQSTTNDPSLKVKAKIMLVANGDTTSPYEDYKTNILHTSEEIVLREVGGVQDTYNLLTGEYTKRIGEITLNGSENEWEDWNENSFVLRGSYFSDAIEHSSPTAPRLKCNNMVAGLGETPRTVRYYNYSTVLWTMVGKNDGETLDQFKQWLSQNPATIQYILAEPITTIVEPSTMTPFAYQNGHVILESGYEGQSLLPTLEYSTVVNRTGQVESVAKTIQTQEKQLTMLEKMLIGNIIELDYNNTLMALNLKMDEVK